MISFDIINPIRRPDWDDLVLATEEYSFFHSSAWAETLQSAYSYRPAYFTVTEADRLLALIPMMEVRSFLTGKRGVSLTFADYCEPIVKNPALFPVLLEQVVDHGRKCGWCYVEFRGGQKFLTDAPVFANYLGHTLKLCDDEQLLLARFRSSTRRNITKAVLEGVTTEISTTLHAVEEYYRLHCLTRKRHGLPPQPFRFFRSVHDCIISRGKGFVVLGSHNNKIIAGAIYFHFGNKALYKFGASDETYQLLRANNLVMWEAIRWYALNHYDTFCFGRTDCDHTGLRQFKNGWGTKENIIHYYKYDMGTNHYISKRVQEKSRATELLGIMPNQALKLIGRFLYRHIG